MLKLVSPSDDGLAPPSPKGAVPAPRYWAFLSYSHHDKVVAKRVQKQLETYRVPKRLVGRETSVGPVPQRVSPVFRDRDELHAGADLKASVQEALSRSRWLIVVCTPDSARSPWVNREIIEFKKLHGERRVLALIVRGEPLASDTPGREAEECFPPALRRALTADGRAEGEPLEPIAADMRKQGDGEQRAVLKLLAGMLAVPFDDLVRRDMQRRVRVLSAVASASALGVVMFAFLAVMAVKARNEAQHQRVQAEGLIEFMLGDLRKKLEPVGRLEVLDSVGEKALAYYVGKESSSLDATALGHRSRAMHLIGEIRDLRGQPGEAQKAFEQAAETTAQILAKRPDDTSRIFDHAQSVFWVGYAAWKRADAKTAETKFADYQRLAEQLVAIDPAHADWQAELAHAQLNLAVVRLGMGRADEARALFMSASDLFSRLVEQKPDLIYDLAGSHGWLAMTNSLLGLDREALLWQQRRVTLLRSVSGAEKNRMAQHELSLALLTQGRFELSLGLVGDALGSVEAAAAIAEELTRADPQNFRWQLDACAAQVRLVEVLFLRQSHVNVGAARSRIQGCAESVEASDAVALWDTVSSKVGVFNALLLLSEGSEKDAVAEKLREFLEASLARMRPDTLDRDSLIFEIAGSYVLLGDVKAQRNQSAGLPAWRIAHRLLEPYVSTGQGAALTDLARVKLRLNDVQGARLLAGRIEQSNYRHPTFRELAGQLQDARQGLATLNGAKR